MVSAFQISAANGVIVDDMSMTQWMQTSFWGLRTDRHRHMFLDAAILLQGQPLQDLRYTWTAMVHLDDDCAEDPDAAAYSVSACIEELVASSLISIKDSTGGQQWWKGLQRRVVAIAPSADLHLLLYNCLMHCCLLMQ